MTDGNIIYASESVTSLLEHLPVSIIWLTNDHFYVANPFFATIDDHPPMLNYAQRITQV